MKIYEHNTSENVAELRQMSNDELAKYNNFLALETENVIILEESRQAKAAAQAKLAALGFTTDDLKALGLGGNE